MAVILSLFAGVGAQFFDNNGDPLSGGLIYTYAAGTTSPQATYTTSTGSTPHANPIVLDAAGRVNEIWLDDTQVYKFVLQTALSITIGTFDNVPGAISSNAPTFIGPVTVSGDLTVTGNVSGTWAGGTIPVAKGGTGATTAATARTNLGAAASGAVDLSGLTMNTARLLGRTTASAGAVEEITVGTGLSLTGGSLAVSAQSQLREQLFLTSGTWTAPTGVTQVRLVVIGGGGGGGGYNSTGGTNDGGNGGSAGVAVGNVTVVPGTAYTVTVGAGGAGGGTNANGTAGSTTSFGALMSATGGGAGLTNGSVGANGAGASGTTRNTNTSVTTMAPFGGSNSRAAGSGAATAAWAINSANGAGAFGTGGDVSQAAAGAVNGIVYVEWVA